MLVQVGCVQWCLAGAAGPGTARGIWAEEVVEAPAEVLKGLAGLAKMLVLVLGKALLVGSLAVRVGNRYGLSWLMVSNLWDCM